MIIDFLVHPFLASK